jgi:hypothetical protein
MYVVFVICIVDLKSSDKPIPNTEWVRAWLCTLQKGCTRLAADIAEILLKVALKHQQIKSKTDYINNHILNVYLFVLFICDAFEICDLSLIIVTF